MKNLGIVYRDGTKALFWRLPDDNNVPFLTARNIFPGDYATLPENKIAVVSVHEQGAEEALRLIFTMALNRPPGEDGVPPCAKAVIPDLLRSPKGPEFVAMLRSVAARSLNPSLT